MAKQVQLKAKTRLETGRGPMKRMRSAGVVPGVVYGAHTKPFNVTVDLKELGTLLEHATGENLLVDLVVEDAKEQQNRLALIQEVQHHPVKDMIMHVDFHEVLATEKLRTVVPVRSHGEPTGVKNGGGVLEYVMRELHVECLPKDLPDVIEVNVEAMEIGQSIHVRDIQAPAGVTLLDQKDMAVFIVVAPIAEEVAATPTEGAVEPEVITAKKEEGEEGEAPAADAKGKAEAKPKAEAGKAEAKPAAGAAAKPGADAKAGAAPKAGAAKPAGKK